MDRIAAYRRAGLMGLLLALLGILVLAPARGSAQAACSPTSTRLCLQGSRFQVEVTWTAPGFGSGPGQAVPLTGDTGVLLVLLEFQRRADGQGARRPGGEPAFLGVLRRALGRRLHADGHRRSDGRPGGLHQPPGAAGERGGRHRVQPGDAPRGRGPHLLRGGARGVPSGGAGAPGAGIPGERHDRRRPAPARGGGRSGRRLHGGVDGGPGHHGLSAGGPLRPDL